MEIPVKKSNSCKIIIEGNSVTVIGNDFKLVTEFSELINKTLGEIVYGLEEEKERLLKILSR